jgi:hypothetical protein
MHTSESLNTNERLRQPAPIDYDPVISWQSVPLRRISHFCNAALRRSATCRASYLWANNIKLPVGILPLPNHL